MGNEFGHPEWLDFPREGNDWSYHYCRRQWVRGGAAAGGGREAAGSAAPGQAACSAHFIQPETDTTCDVRASLCPFRR